MSRLESFANTLEEEYQFPAEYKFKFIVSSESISKVLHLIQILIIQKENQRMGIIPQLQ